MNEVWADSATGDGPDLLFGPSTDRAGFTPAGIAAFSDLRPAAVVRELIQNSLDAALIEADQPCAYVRFEETTCESDDIPGIDSYRTAFELAVKEQKPSGSARSVVDRIRRTLEKTSHSVLCVLDNGIGLDGRRMSALLSDGVSAKGGSASGTFGNGHSVVIPASNLRYVLYGGITRNGQSYGAGQAVLASHRRDGIPLSLSGRGVYLESFQPSSDDVPFTFAQGEAIPSIIAQPIESVRSQFGHGTAVIVPAFNSFEDDQPLRDAVFKAASFNFFQAIHESRLVIEVVTPDGSGVLDGNSLLATLEPYREEMRTRRTGSFLSGRKANEAYQCLIEGEQHEIVTAQGKVTVRLLKTDSGRTSVGLCRNGMWITDELPMFQNAFADRAPFQALILLDSTSGTSFFDLVREAETPLHDKLVPKQLDTKRRKALRDALREIRDGISELVPASSEEVYSPPDILAFQFEDVEGQTRGGRQPSYWGQLGSSHRPPAVKQKQGQLQFDLPGGGTGRGGNNGNSPKKKRHEMIVSAPLFRIASVPAGERRRRIHVECTEEFSDAVLRIFIDENVDATCDRQTRAQVETVLLSDVMVNGQPLKERELLRSGEDIVGARLGTLQADSSVVVETECSLPESAGRLPHGKPPAFRIEISRGLKPASGGTTSTTMEVPSDG